MTKLDEIREELRQLRALIEEANVGPDDLVDAHYVARRADLSPRTVREGKARTCEIPRALDRPLRFRRADVDRWLRSLPDRRALPQERARVLIHRQRTKTRKKAA